jgi:hypothetical protein
MVIRGGTPRAAGEREATTGVPALPRRIAGDVAAGSLVRNVGIGGDDFRTGRSRRRRHREGRALGGSCELARQCEWNGERADEPEHGE